MTATACIKVVQPSLICSITSCVSGVPFNTQYGPCLYSSAVVLGLGDFSDVAAAVPSLHSVKPKRTGPAGP